MSLAQLKLLKTVITAKAVSNSTHLCAELAAQGMAEGKPAWHKRRGDFYVIGAELRAHVGGC